MASAGRRAGRRLRPGGSRERRRPGRSRPAARASGRAMTAARRILRLASRAAGKSDVGRVREVNEDRLLLLDHAGRGIAVYAVADGLGGHAGGDVASTLAVETLAREIPALLAQGAPPQDALLEAVRRANAAIHGAAQGTERAGMATTCTAVVGVANARGGVDNASAIVIRLAPWRGGRAMRLLAPIGLVAFIAGGLAADRLEHAYFLGVRDDRIAVMRGVPVSVLGVPLSGVIKVTRVPVSQVAPANRSRLAQGIPTASPEEAERMVPGLLAPP